MADGCTGVAIQILESWCRMRLMRYQPRTVQAKILSTRSQLNSTGQRDRKEEATNSFEAAIPAYEKLDYLISEATKREAILLAQFHCTAWPLRRIARKQALEEKKIELAERKRRERNERAIEHFFKTRQEKRQLNDPKVSPTRAPNMTEIQSDVYAVACSKAESYFDLEAMKRRLARPPCSATAWSDLMNSCFRSQACNTHRKYLLRVNRCRAYPVKTPRGDLRRGRKPVKVPKMLCGTG